MWKGLWFTALRHARTDSVFKGSKVVDMKFLRRFKMITGHTCCSSYSTSLSSRKEPWEFGVNSVDTEVTSLEKNIQDAKELLELDSFPSLASLTLKSLFSNQVDVIRAHMVKLVGSHHPILRLAQDFYQENLTLFQKTNSTLPIFDENPTKAAIHSSLSIQLRAIIVLLVSKSIGFPLTSMTRATEAEFTKAIQNKQRAIAEITEIMHTAYTLHQTVLNIPNHEVTNVPSLFSEPATVSRLHDGNNLAALMGDFLLAKTSGGLSSLKNAVVTELMTNTISDFAESQFVGMEIRTKKRSAISEELWFRKNRLGTGSLLRNACQSCLIFSGHEEPIINLGKHLGEQLGLLLQASKEIEFYTNKTEEIPIQFDLCTLPVIHAVQSNYISVERLTALAEDHDYEQIYNKIVQCEESIDDATSKVLHLQKNIEKMLTQLNSTSPEAVSILIKLIRCVTSSAVGQRA